MAKKQSPKILVVYYTRTGKTREVAISIAEKLNAEIEQIIDKKSRKGIIGWLSGGKDAAQEKAAEIGPIKKDPKDYDIVIIGTPVWANNMAPAVRTYLTHNADKIKKAAFFCTAGGSGVKNTLTEMLLILVGAKCLANIGIIGAEFSNRHSLDTSITSFTNTIIK